MFWVGDGPPNFRILIAATHKEKRCCLLNKYVMWQERVGSDVQVRRVWGRHFYTLKCDMQFQSNERPVPEAAVYAVCYFTTVEAKSKVERDSWLELPSQINIKTMCYTRPCSSLWDLSFQLPPAQLTDRNTLHSAHVTSLACVPWTGKGIVTS